MTAVCERQTRHLFRPALRPASPLLELAPRRRWWRWAAALVLGGYLLFAHGCHGDEDSELFAVRRATRWGKLKTCPTGFPSAPSEAAGHYTRMPGASNEVARHLDHGWLAGGP